MSAIWPRAVHPSGVSMSQVRVGRSLSLAALISAVSIFGATAAPVSGQGTWEKTLKARDLDGNLSNGPEAYYDTSLNITWLSNVASNPLPWGDAVALVSGLEVGGNRSWRLPSMVDLGQAGCATWAAIGSDCGYNVDSSTSEIAHLFYKTLGNLAYDSPDGGANPNWGVSVNSGPFQDLIPHHFWFGLEVTDEPRVAWKFDTNTGEQNIVDKRFSQFVLAVHDGDVGVLTTVPEPESWALAVVGLGIAGLAVRRRV
jgi:PEP-CTERM motif